MDATLPIPLGNEKWSKSVQKWDVKKLCEIFVSGQVLTYFSFGFPHVCTDHWRQLAWMADFIESTDHVN